MRKTTVALLLALSLLLGVGGAAFAEAPSGSSTLRYGVSFIHLENLDLHYTTYSEPYEAAMQTHEPLLSKNPDGSIYPLLLAEMPTVSEDGLMYTFKLKEGITFHDGSELTSEDVAATFRKLMAPEPVSVNAPVFAGTVAGAKEYAESQADDISGIAILDDYTFTITLIAPNVTFLDSLATYTALIYPRFAAQTPGWGTDVFIGTGPFQAKEFVPGVKLVLTKYEGYHGGAKALDTIEFLNMDENTALLEFEAGSIDLTKISDAALIKSYNDDPQYASNIIKSVSKATIAMSFNMNQEPFSNVLVRKAISLAINREEIANKLLGGTVVPAYSFLPEGVLGFDSKQAPIPYEPEKVKALLAEAGYPDGIQIQAVSTDSSSNTVILQYLEQTFKECGIVMNLQIMDAASFGDLRAQGAVPMFILTWASDAGDPGDMLNLYSTPFSQYISSFYMNAEFDDALAQGLTMLDAARRAEHYRQMDVKLTQVDYACAPISHPSSFLMVQDRVSNLVLGNVFRMYDVTLK